MYSCILYEPSEWSTRHSDVKHRNLARVEGVGGDHPGTELVPAALYCRRAGGNVLYRFINPIPPSTTVTSQTEYKYPFFLYFNCPAYLIEGLGCRTRRTCCTRRTSRIRCVRLTIRTCCTRRTRRVRRTRHVQRVRRVRRTQRNFSII